MHCGIVVETIIGLLLADIVANECWLLRQDASMSDARLLPIYDRGVPLWSPGMRRHGRGFVEPVNEEARMGIRCLCE